MALLKKLNHTVDDNRLILGDYSNSMCAGEWLVSATVSVDSAHVVVTVPDIIEPGQITFFVGGGVLGEDFIVSVSVTKNTTEEYNDTIEFHVVAP